MPSLSNDYKSCLIFSFVAGLVLFVFGVLMGLAIENSMAGFTFEVNSLDVTSLTISRPDTSVQINSDFNLTLTVKTKKAKTFDRLHVTAIYGGQVLSSTVIEPFDQDAHTVSIMDLSLSATTQLEGAVADSMIKILVSGGKLSFTIMISGYIDELGDDNSKVGVVVPVFIPYAPMSTPYYGDEKYESGSGQQSCNMKMVCRHILVTLSSSNNTWKGRTLPIEGPFPCKYSSSRCS